MAPFAQMIDGFSNNALHHCFHLDSKNLSQALRPQRSAEPEDWMTRVLPKADHILPFMFHDFIT
jgi:hypothetical protein